MPGKIRYGLCMSAVPVHIHTYIYCMYIILAYLILYAQIYFYGFHTALLAYYILCLGNYVHYSHPGLRYICYLHIACLKSQVCLWSKLLFNALMFLSPASLSLPSQWQLHYIRTAQLLITVLHCAAAERPAPSRECPVNLSSLPWPALPASFSITVLHSSFTLPLSSSYPRPSVSRPPPSPLAVYMSRCICCSLSNLGARPCFEASGLP